MSEQKPKLFSSLVFNKSAFDSWKEEGYPHSEHSEELWNKKTGSFGVWTEEEAKEPPVDPPKTVNTT